MAQNNFQFFLFYDRNNKKVEINNGGKGFNMFTIKTTLN